MAEFFESASATNINDLLSRIQVVLANNGYTVHSSSSEGTGRRVHLSKGDLFVNFRSGVDNEVPYPETGNRWTSWNWNRYQGNPRVYYHTDWLALNVGSGYDGSRNWYNQPGVHISGDNVYKGISKFMEAHGAISKYWMFLHENPDSFYLIVEWSPGRFSWLGFGMIKKPYEYQGGRFYGASRYVNDHYGYPYPLKVCDVQALEGEYAAENNGWGRSNVSSPNQRDSSSTVYFDAPFVPHYQFYLSSSADDVNDIRNYHTLHSSYIGSQARSVLYPVYGFVQRSPAGYSALGSLPNSFYTSTEPYVGGDQINIGGEVYMVFPFYDRGAPWIGWRDTGGSSSNWESYKVYHYGIGMAVRRPADG